MALAGISGGEWQAFLGGVQVGEFENANLESFFLKPARPRHPAPDPAQVPRPGDGDQRQARSQLSQPPLGGSVAIPAADARDDVQALLDNRQTASANPGLPEA